MDDKFVTERPEQVFASPGAKPTAEVIEPTGLQFLYQFHFGPYFRERISKGAEVTLDQSKLTSDGGTVHLEARLDGKVVIAFDRSVRPVEFHGAKLIVIETI